MDTVTFSLSYRIEEISLQHEENLPNRQIALSHKTGPSSLQKQDERGPVWFRLEKASVLTWQCGVQINCNH